MKVKTQKEKQNVKNIVNHLEPYLLSKFLVGASKNKMTKYFKKANISNAMTTYACPSCHDYFSLNNKFISEFEEVNFKYTCPYCGVRCGIDD